MQASHQCGPGSIPGLGFKYGLSLSLVLALAPRGFSSGTPVFPYISKFQLTLKSPERNEPIKYVFTYLFNVSEVVFNISSQVHNYGTRTAGRYRSHSCRTNLKQFTILYQGPKIWNSLPISISSSSSFLTFTKKMLEFYL